MLAIRTDGAIRSGADAAALFRHRLAGLDHEQFHAVHLDDALHPLGRTELVGRRSVELCFRHLVADALRLDARAMLVAHNHPGGDPTPSLDDKVATRRLADLLRPLDIRLVDHLVFGDDRHVSFRGLGLL